MKLYLVRHGETEWNKERRLQGRADVPLNKTGRDQVRELRDKIADMQFTVCIASPLRRARETAEIVTDGKCEIKFDDRLMERDFGEFEGMPLDDWHEKIGDIDTWDRRVNWGEKGFESIKTILARAEKFLNDVKKNYAEDAKILIVAHGSLLKALHFVIVGYDDETDFHTLHFENAEMREYEIARK